MKVAGVRAGQRHRHAARPRTPSARWSTSRSTKTGFGSLRTDAFCETRPQSLIGEYFVDCRPGTAPERLRSGATIPVEQTASTIPVDLDQQHHAPPLPRAAADHPRRARRRRRRPRPRTSRPRCAARVPALRETDRVLAILAEQNKVLGDLTANADTVIGDLAGNRKDVGRWVTRDAGRPPSASAERRAEIAASLRRLPGFLRELEPTMAELGAAADAQSPALEDLNASAGQLARLLREPARPFARRLAHQPRPRSPSSAARRAPGRCGRPSRRSPSSTRFSTKTPELANNLRFVLRDLDDRERAVEPDPRSPGRQGLHGPRGAPPVRLRPVDGDQHLRRERLHAEGQPLPLRVLGVPEPPSR